MGLTSNEGALRTRKWQNKEGHDQYTTEIVASDMQMLGGKQESATSQSSEQRQSAPRQAPPAPQNNVFDSGDIPF